jgi:peroxiredoxin 2/4
MTPILLKAPDFKAKAVVGKGDFKEISLSDYAGKYVVLFFYPLDFTFICPTEITQFSKRYDDFKALDAVVLGCSIDSVHSHKAWIEKDLGPQRYPLLSDITHDISRAYGAYIETSGHSTRATFIIDPDGIVQYASSNNTDVGRSVDETLRVLQAIQTGERCTVDWKPGGKTLGKG